MNDLDNLSLVKRVWEKTFASELKPLPPGKIEDAIKELIEKLTKNKFTTIGDGIHSDIHMIEK